MFNVDIILGPDLARGPPFNNRGSYPLSHAVTTATIGIITSVDDNLAIMIRCLKGCFSLCVGGGGGGET